MWTGNVFNREHFRVTEIQPRRHSSSRRAGLRIRIDTEREDSCWLKLLCYGVIMFFNLFEKFTLKTAHFITYRTFKKMRLA